MQIIIIPLYVNIPQNQESDENENISTNILNPTQNIFIADINNNAKNDSIFVSRKSPQKRGRISDSNKEKGIFGLHNKNKLDNVICKVKTVLINSLGIFINKNLQKNLGPNFRLKKLQHGYIRNMKTEFNKILLRSKIKDIFSSNISQIYRDDEKDHNKKLINTIYNLYTKENENIKYKEIIDIFEKTLLQCLELIRGTNNYFELNGLKEIFDGLVNEKLNEGEIEYNNSFWSVVNGIENIFAKKLGRRSKKDRMDF